MGVLSRIFGIEARAEGTGEGLVDLFGARSSAGVTVSPSGAMKLAPVWSCVHLLANSAAQLPLLIYYRKRGNDRQRAADHPLYELLHLLPNPELTSFELRQALMGHLLTWGNGYCEIEWAPNGTVRGLWPLNPGAMTGAERKDGALFYAYQLPNGTMTRIPAYRVLHLRGLSSDGFWGLSPVRELMETMGLAKVTEQYGGRYFANGANPSVILIHPGTPKADARARIRREYMMQTEGLSNAHRVAVLADGIQVEKVGVPPDEAQFLETRTFQDQEIVRAYLPHMVLNQGDAYANVEDLGRGLVTFTLQPWLVSIEQAIMRDLFTARDRQELMVEHLVDGLMRASTQNRYAAYAVAHRAWMTTNDIRRLENLPPVEGGDDDLMQPLNMEPVGSTRQAEPPELWESRAIAAVPDGEERAIEYRRTLFSSQAPLFYDVAERITRRESNDVGRAVLKYLKRTNNLAGFLMWMQEFYEEHAGFVDRQMAPVVQALARLVGPLVARELGVEVDAGVLAAFAAEFTATLGVRWAASSHGQLRQVLQAAQDAGQALPDAVQGRLDEWNETRPGKVSARESVRSTNALIRSAYMASGVERLRWVARGENCPYCEAMNGRVVGIREDFMAGGQQFSPKGAQQPLLIRNSISHPPIHDGCDCTIVAER